MHIGIVRLSLALPSETLKEKRTIVRSVIERLRNRFNAAVAEVGDQDAPGRAVIAAAVISTDGAHAQSQLQAIVDAVTASRLDVVLVDIETETFAL